MADKVLQAVIKARDEASPVFKAMGKEAEQAAKAGESAGKAQTKDGEKQESLLKRMAQRAKELRREGRASGEGALGKMLDSPSGMSRAVFQQLGIGLQAVAVEKIGEAFAAVGSKIVEVQKGLREGTEDWRSSINKISQEIPLLGGFVKGFNAIREAFTGEQAAIDLTIQQTALLNSVTDHRIERSKALKTVLKEIKKEGVHLDLDLNVIGKEGYERARSEFEKKQDKDKEAFEEGQQARVKEEQEAFEKERRELQNKISEEKAKGVQARQPGLLDDLNTQLSAEEARHGRAKDQIEIANAANAVKFAKKQDKEAAEWRKENNARALELIADYNTQARRLAQAGMDQQAKDIKANNVLRLEAMGEGLHAEVLGLQNATEAEKQALARRAEMEAEEIQRAAQKQAENATPERAKEIKEAAERKIAALVSNAKARGRELDAALELNTTARIKNYLDESNLRILQMQAEAGDERARVEGETVARLNEELALRKNLQKIAGDKTATEGERKAARDRLSALDQAGQKRNTRQVENIELAAQELQSQVGETANERLEAAQKATRTRMMREFEARKAEVEKMLGDNTATDEQKKRAREGLEAWAKLQGRAFDKALNVQAVPLKATADTSESPFITGMELRAIQKADYQKDLIQVTQAGNDFLSQILEAVKNMKPTEIKATVGVPYR